MGFALRLFVAGAMGVLIGLEREYRAKEAGYRTHFLVALGSALMMIVSQYGFMEVLKTDLHSIDAQVVFYSGDAAIVFPAVYIQGSAPGAVDVNGCAVSESIALDLFGSTDIVGQTLQIGDRNVQIRGVFQGQTNLAITAAQESDMLKNVELVGSPGGDLREMAVDYVTAAGLVLPIKFVLEKPGATFLWHCVLSLF